MADHERTTTKGSGGLAGFTYDLGGADRGQTPCDLPAAVPCYPHYTYDAAASTPGVVSWLTTSGRPPKGRAD